MIHIRSARYVIERTNIFILTSFCYISMYWFCVKLLLLSQDKINLTIKTQFINMQSMSLTHISEIGKKSCYLWNMLQTHGYIMMLISKTERIVIYTKTKHNPCNIWSFLHCSANKILPHDKCLVEKWKRRFTTIDHLIIFRHYSISQ